MFLGQVALAFAAKRGAPRASLGALILAALLPDLIWIALVIAGVEQVRFERFGAGPTPIDYTSWPISHSLVLVLLWGIAAAAIYRARTGYGAGARAIVALVAGHWLLEMLAHRPDLPLVPGLPFRVGLGLGAIPYAMIPFEAALFCLGLALYLDLTRPIRREGRVGLLGMIGFACGLFLGTATGLVPWGIKLLLATSVATWILVPWAVWVDRWRAVPGEP